MIKKIGIFGNRDIKDEHKILHELADLLDSVGVTASDHVLILHGGAQGVSSIVATLASEMTNWSSVIFKPWSMVWPDLKFSTMLFYLRNKQIVDNSDVVVIFTNGEHDSEVVRVKDLCTRWKKPHFIVHL
jgi:hypothetical protein